MDASPVYVGCFAAGTTLLLLLVMRAAQRFVAPSASTEADDKNVARALLHVGQLVAVFAVAAAAVKNCVQGVSIGHDVAWVGAFSLVALALVVITGRFGIQLLLRSTLPKEIDQKNAAVGAAAGAHYAACGIVTAESFAGHDLRGLLLSLAFFGLAQITLHLFVTSFRALTTYDDAEEIRGGNLAAALSYGGLAIAVALIIGRALEGDFTGWASSLRGYALALPIVVTLYPVRQLLVQTFLLGAPFTLRGGRLDDAILRERAVGMGALEAASYVATALATLRLAT
jgi:uncharacterized membrane protein YjfL (UPF0719 family)